MTKYNRRRQEPQDAMEDGSKNASKAVFCCGMSKCKFFTVLGIVVGVVIIIVVGLKIGLHFGLKNQQKNNGTSSNTVSFYEWPAVAPEKVIPLDQFLNYVCSAVAEVVLAEFKRPEVVQLMVDWISSLKRDEVSRSRNYTDPTFVGDQPKTAEEKTVSCMKSITARLVSMIPTSPAVARRQVQSKLTRFLDRLKRELPVVFIECIMEAFAPRAGAARTGKLRFDGTDAMMQLVSCVSTKTTIKGEDAALSAYGQCITPSEAGEGERAASEKMITYFNYAMSTIGSLVGGIIGAGMNLASFASDAMGIALNALAIKASGTCACNPNQPQCNSWCECRRGSSTVDCWCCIHGNCKYEKEGPPVNTPFGMGPMLCLSACFISCSTYSVGTTDIGVNSQCSIV